MPTFHPTLTRICDDGEIEIPVRVEYAFYPGHPATWGYAGGDPAEPERAEINAVRNAQTGERLNLTKAELQVLEEAALEDHAGRMEVLR